MYVIALDLLEFMDRFINHARRRPNVIINRGSIFNGVGSMNIWLVSSISHLIELPAIMDITPRSMVGKIIRSSSLTARNGLERLGPHSTISLNRTE